MSQRARFKWQRALPREWPVFEYNHFKPVRSLATSTAIAIQGAGPIAIASCVIPGNTWAYGKVVRITCAAKMTIGMPGVVPGFIITETMTLIPTSACVLWVPPLGFSGHGTQTSVMVLRAIRLPGTPFDRVVCWNEGSCMQVSAWNESDFSDRYHDMGWGIGIPDFSLDMTLSWTVNIPGSMAPISIVPLFARAFIESPINIGSLP